MKAVIRETGQTAELVATTPVVRADASGAAPAAASVAATTAAVAPQGAATPPPSRPEKPAAHPAIRQADGSAALLALLRIEADVRNVENERDLMFFIANETRKLTRARQIFVLRSGLSGAQEVNAVSSLSTVDRNAPLIALIEKVVAAKADADGEAESLGSITALELFADDPIAKAYPFRELVWVPLRHRQDDVPGGMVLAREDEWQDSDMVVAKRLSATYGHAWKALLAPTRQKVRQWLKPNRWQAVIGALALASMFLIKVPLTALAPVEIVARNPFVVTAPMDGVIERVIVDINQPVIPGALLIELADTTLSNRLEVADREVEVATARLKQVNQLAFTDPQGMHELGIARAELQLKTAERDFARDLLSKSEIRALRSGVAIYSDKRELTGKPVAVGERILEIADPTRVEARISLPVADAIALQEGARVKLFLDSDPLRPWEGVVIHADYKARVTENDVVSFRVVAGIDARGTQRVLPRLGNRGTAQIFGGDVSLAFYLFRRPLAAARQWFGI